MPTSASPDEAKLHQDIHTAQAALDELKRSLSLAPIDDLSRRATGRARRYVHGERRSMATPDRPIKFSSLVKSVAAVVIVGAGGYCWKLQMDAQEAALAQAQILVGSRKCERIYRSAGMISADTDACLAAAHLVEGR